MSEKKLRREARKELLCAIQYSATEAQSYDGDQARLHAMACESLSRAYDGLAATEANYGSLVGDA